MWKYSFKLVNVIGFRNSNNLIRYKSSLVNLSYSQTDNYKKGVYRKRIASKDDHNLTLGETMKNVEDIINVKFRVAFDIVTRTKKLCKLTYDEISTNYKICSEYVVDKTVIKYPEILTASELQEKIELLKVLPYNLNSTIVLSCLDMEKLQQFLQKEIPVPSGKIKLLMKQLKVSDQKACEILCAKQFLTTIDSEKIQNNIQLLKDYGFTLEDIQNDLWVLRYNKNLIHNRLSVAKSYNIDELKTWMIRPSKEVLENYIKRRSEDKQILGGSSLTEFLSKTLDCSEQQAMNLLARLPALKTKSKKKIKEISDLLFKESFKPYHIYRVPKILLHSVQTTNKRLKELAKEGVKIDSLYVLTKSQKQYSQYLETVVSSRTKIIK